jgi:hypothetical protein
MWTKLKPNGPEIRGRLKNKVMGRWAVPLCVGWEGQHWSCLWAVCSWAKCLFLPHRHCYVSCHSTRLNTPSSFTQPSRITLEWALCLEDVSQRLQICILAPFSACLSLCFSTFPQKTAT